MKRDSYWDTLKFILIFLVVYGHVLNATTLPDDYSKAMVKFIYMFHMPLFIFISGRFSHIHDRAKYKKSIIRLLETFAVFMLITSFLKFGLMPMFSYIKHPSNPININMGEWFDYLIATPSYLWYLLTLAYYRIMVYLSPQEWINKKKKILVESIIISIIAGFIPIGYAFSFQRTLAFLPFFVMGYYSANCDVKNFVRKIPLQAAAWGG